MKYKGIVGILLVVICALFQVNQVSQASTGTIIFAADMPDIFDTRYGKYPQLKTLIKNVSQTSGEQTFFVFGGGSLGPSAMSAFDKGSHIIDILNTLEPDVMGVTKREFSYLTDELSLRAYESAFPIVTSNIKDLRIDETPDGLQSLALIEKNGISLGFISIINSRLNEEYLVTNIRVQPPEESLKQASYKLRKMGADIVLLHYSFPFDFVPEMVDSGMINLAFLSDTRLQAQYRKEVTEHPKILLLDEPGRALKAQFAFEETFKLIDVESIDLNSLAADDETAKLVVNYQSRLAGLLNEPIGKWHGDYSTRREDVRGGENAFANYIADAMKFFADTDIAILNGGSIRGDKYYTDNTLILRKDIASELPFRSRLRVLKVNGEEIRQTLEAGLANLDDLKGGFPHVSGMKVFYDSEKPPGERVVQVNIKGRPLAMDESYTLASTDYLASGGDNYWPLRSAEASNDLQTLETILIVDLVVRAISNQGKLKSKIDQRMVDIALSNNSSESTLSTKQN
uniref:bifunctional metallophosphatase/5'-nucleotidase n=1 Tax=Ningiella ruwaisensis TaxID=2364274 RepID=UPI00109F0E48|nr:5'-nucleotidase C-terminal domain-containing protein [Ningiella ruwaisensis]